LRAIDERPGVVSTLLAEQVGLDRPALKLNVRKLKALGLTESLEVGYRLSPRGAAALAALG
jgi:predicted transcriptional regulator